MLAAALAISACGGEDTPDTDGGLSAAELAAMLPDGGTPQAIAVDVDAAREAAGLAEGTDPTEISTSREELRFGLSTFSALLSLAALTDNPVRAAIDHSKLSAYAAHPYISDDAVALLSTTQDFEEIASSLEDAGWERDGDVLSTDGDPQEVTYTAVAAADGYVVLASAPEGVEAAASGDAEPSDDRRAGRPRGPRRSGGRRRGARDSRRGLRRADQLRRLRRRDLPLLHHG